MIRQAHTFRLALIAALASALLIVPVAAAGDPGPDAFERAVNARISMQMPDAVDRAVNARIAGSGGKLSELALSAQMAGPNFSQTSTAGSSGKLSELALSAKMAGPNFAQTSAGGPGPDAFERAVNAHNASLGSIASPGRTVPDVVEAIGSSAVTASSAGFDWTSAAIGGSAMLALVLLVSGGAIATRHSRGRVALR